MTAERLAEIRKRMFDKCYMSPLLQDAYEEIMRQRELLQTMAIQQPNLVVSEGGKVADVDAVRQ
jgi:hypothetical protein